jgi:hypothetical protein
MKSKSAPKFSKLYGKLVEQMKQNPQLDTVKTFLETGTHRTCSRHSNTQQLKKSTLTAVQVPKAIFWGDMDGVN